MGILPRDVAPVPLELDQAQVDHAIAKMTKQEEEEAAAKCTIDENNVTPVYNTSKPVSVVIGADQPHASQSNGDNDVKVSSPPVNGECKTITHALKKKVESKCTYKCHV